MPRTVAIVFEPDYAERLEKLAFHTPVWIVDTPANRTAAELAWRTAVEWPHISVTLFRRDEEWKALLRQVQLNERGVDAVDVIGISLSDDARTALAKVGFEKVDATASGFRAAKPKR